jgi:hypothetical protein
VDRCGLRRVAARLRAVRSGRKISVLPRARARAARRAWEGTADTAGATRTNRIGLLLAALVALAGLARLVDVAVGQLSSPYDLMYESPNLATIRLVDSGRSPYDPAVYAGGPFILTPYTPLYFYALAALPEVAARPFLVGRLASLLCAAICAAVLALHARRVSAALLAVGLFALSWTVATYATYLRMDLPALALSALSLLALLRPTPRRVTLAALLAVLAVATKQSYVAALVAGGLHLLLRDRRLALRFGAVAAGSIIALAMLATGLWGHGFWELILVLRTNPVTLETFRAQAQLAVASPVFDLLLLAALVSGALALRRQGLEVLRRSPVPLYLLISAAVLVGTMGKQGSSTSYFLELALALPLWLTTESVRETAPAAARGAFFVLLVACIGLDLRAGCQPGWPIGFEPNTEEIAGPYYAIVRERLRREGLPAPRLLNLGPARFGYGIADEVCMSDVSTYDQLYEQGALDPRPLEEAIRAREYDVVLVTSFATPENMAGRPLKAAIQLVRDNYRPMWSDPVGTFYRR